MVKSLHTTHFVLMLSGSESVEAMEKEKKERGFMMDCSRAKGAWLVCRPRTQRASERALVIWSVRQLGLSSETRRGEVGDQV